MIKVPLLLLLSLPVLAPGPPARLDGAFIQLDGRLARQGRDAWGVMLDRMRAADLRIVIVQYAETRWREQPTTARSFLPARPGDPDPIGAILDDADAHPGMAVFLGLRYDARLLRSERLNDPTALREALADELPRNIDLARRLTDRYHLRDRGCFAGWYLPLEVANYNESATKPEDGWVFQVGRFTQALSRACRGLVDCPVAASPYFNGRIKDQPWLVPPAQMGTMFARFLEEAELSLIMLQDGVGVAHLPADEVESYVLPYLVEIEKACKRASRPDRRIDLWLNVESIDANITRLDKQMALSRGHCSRMVTFDFPNYLGKPPLYEDYLQYIQRNRRPGP